MKNNILLLLSLLFGCFTHSSKVMPPDMSAVYNTKVKYKLGQKIQFPDFILEFTGKDLQKVPNNANLSITSYIFLLQCNGESKKISWSSGTGLVLSTEFTCQEKIFHLEKAFSDTLGQLKTNELVIIK